MPAPPPRLYVDRCVISVCETCESLKKILDTLATLYCILTVGHNALPMDNYFIIGSYMYTQLYTCRQSILLVLVPFDHKKLISIFIFQTGLTKRHFK